MGWCLPMAVGVCIGSGKRRTLCCTGDGSFQFNSQELLTKVSGKRAKQLADDKRPHEEKIRELYLTALSREPSKEELAALTAHIEKKKGSVQAAYEDILWALINTKEFTFNH